VLYTLQAKLSLRADREMARSQIFLSDPIARMAALIAS
jgi:hypothetical protein